MLFQKLGTCLYLVALVCVLEPGTRGNHELCTLQCRWLCYSKERTHTTWVLLESLEVTGPLLNSLQEATSSLHLGPTRCWSPQAILKTLLAGSTGNYLKRQNCRGRGGTKRFKVAQSPPGRGRHKAAGGSTAHPSGTGLIPAHAQSAFQRQPRARSPSLQNNLFLTLAVRVPGEQSSSAAGHSEAMQSPSLEIFKIS